MKKTKTLFAVLVTSLIFSLINGLVAFAEDPPSLSSESEPRVIDKEGGSSANATVLDKTSKNITAKEIENILILSFTMFILFTLAKQT